MIAMDNSPVVGPYIGYQSKALHNCLQLSFGDRVEPELIAMTEDIPCKGNSRVPPRGGKKVLHLLGRGCCASHVDLQAQLPSS